MTKILVECPQLIPSVRVGVLQPLQPLKESGQCQLRYKDTKEIVKEDIVWCDILICVRGCEYPTLRVMQAAKEVGKFLIYFLDDDLLNIPAGNESTKYYSDHKIKANLVKILSLCDLLWAVNPRILDAYGKWCPRTVLSKVPARILKEPPERTEKIHILYAGSVDHSGLVQEKLAPAVRRILERYSDRVDFTFVGANPEIQDVKGVRFHSFIESYDEYQRMMLQGGFSLGLAPAYRTPFYFCKYYNKFIEYSTYGITGMYEECPPYTDIVEQGKDGFLCGETADDWHRILEEVVRDKWKLKSLAQRAQEKLVREFSEEVIAQELRDEVPELTEYHAPETSEKEVRLPPMKWVFYQRRMQLLCRMYGVLAIFVIPWKAGKKLVKRILGR